MHFDFYFKNINSTTSNTSLTWYALIPSNAFGGGGDQFTKRFSLSIFCSPICKEAPPKRNIR